jgi:DNA-binding NarL/FixJ family response regulator
MEPKVIIADDHSIVRMGLGSLIKQLGVNVVDEVSNCAELMSQLNNQTYSHLILDLIMPDGNALEIAAASEKLGFNNLRRSGLKKVMQGVTSLQEVNRVTSE